VVIKWELVSVGAIALALVTTACNGSDNVAQPSSLPSAARPGNGTQPLSDGSPQPSDDSPSLCTSTDTEPCSGGVESGPPPERSCSMMANGLEVVVRGSRQSSGTVLANDVAQVPPGTQPAPPSGEVVVTPGSGNGSASYAMGDALGNVANIQGQCPNLTFTVGGQGVATNASTRYFGLPSPRP
jgi:hypothetical protein